MRFVQIWEAHSTSCLVEQKIHSAFFFPLIEDENDSKKKSQRSMKGTGKADKQAGRQDKRFRIEQTPKKGGVHLLI